MSMDGLVTVLAAVFNVVLILVSLYVYVSLVRQIASRSGEVVSLEGLKQFGLPEVFVALFLTGLLSANLFFALSHPRDVTKSSTQEILAGVFVTLALLLFLVAYLRVRGLRIGVLAGLAKLGFGRVLSIGTILLFAAYPLIYLADALTQRLLGTGLSKQEIVELFNASQSLTQRVIIIVTAVAIAPMVEEFTFRFFLYGVCRRYLGRFFGVILSSLLFAAVHAHLPSFAPLFVLGSCFAIAYEWSGSILVSMTMHALFNSFMLILLAFPQIAGS